MFIATNFSVPPSVFVLSSAFFLINYNLIFLSGLSWLCLFLSSGHSIASSILLRMGLLNMNVLKLSASWESFFSLQLQLIVLQSTESMLAVVVF